MEYMLIMRTTDEAGAAFQNIDFEEIMEAMGRFNEEMISADYSSQPPVVTDGPYGETRELVTGIDEFPQDNEWIRKERAWREATGQL